MGLRLACLRSKAGRKAAQHAPDHGWPQTTSGIESAFQRVLFLVSWSMYEWTHQCICQLIGGRGWGGGGGGGHPFSFERNVYFLYSRLFCLFWWCCRSFSNFRNIAICIATVYILLFSFFLFRSRIFRFFFLMLLLLLLLCVVWYLSARRGLFSTHHGHTVSSPGDEAPTGGQHFGSSSRCKSTPKSRSELESKSRSNSRSKSTS